jgi:hypothetical protein
MRLGLFGGAAPRISRVMPRDPQISERDLPPAMPPAMVDAIRRQGGDPALEWQAMQGSIPSGNPAPMPVPQMGLIGGAARQAKAAAMKAPAVSAAPARGSAGAATGGAFMQGPKPPQQYESNFLLDAFGYDPETAGMGGLEWWFSAPSQRDAARNEVLGTRAAAQAEAQRQQQRAEIVKMFGPQAGVAFDTNPEKFGEYLGSNYQASNVSAGDSRVFGNGRETFTAPKLGVDGGYGYTQTPEGIEWGDQRGQNYSEATAEGALAETGRHNRATEDVARDRLDFDRSKPTSGGGLTPYQGLQFQFKLDDLDRDLADRERQRQTSLSTVDGSIALLDKFTGDSGTFNEVYGNWINPTGEGDDLLNWRVAPGSPRANGMAILEQLGGRAFLDSIQAMKGTGPLSDREGARVTAAATRLTAVTQSDEAAMEAAKEFKDALLAYRGALERDIQESRAREAENRKRMQAMMGVADTSTAQQSSGLSPEEQSELDALRAELGQ